MVANRHMACTLATHEPTPYIPDYPGADHFKGRQLHTRDYRTAEEFAGQHVIIVGGGISAIQLLDEISRVATTT